MGRRAQRLEGGYEVTRGTMIASKVAGSDGKGERDDELGI
jgi:hypothetical protein